MIRGLVSAVIGFAFFLAVAVHAGPASAQTEGISDFASDITVTRDGTLIVRETLTVRSQGDRILHGIFRDFPTTYIDRAGRRVRVGFDVQSVTRDGAPEPYEVQNIDNGKRVRIGDADTLLMPGTHVYAIAYTTNRQIGFFDTYDELYWNVTGNAWAFTIDQAESVVHLPAGATITQDAVYTGVQGSRETNAAANRLSNDTIGFRTTGPLAPGEGLTVAVGFSKGVVAPPSDVEKTADFLRDNASIGAAAIGLVALFAFYFYIWRRVGRDPARGVIVPLFAPPKDFSAAAVRFVYRMAYDRKAFAAALIAMAVKNYLTISEDAGTYTLRRTGKSEDETGLASTERAIARALFSGGDEIVLENTNHTAVSRAVSGLREALRREDEGVYFVTNRGWFFTGIAILVASAVGTALLSDSPQSSGLLAWLAPWSAGTAFVVYRAFQMWKDALYGPGFRVGNVIGALFYSVFAVPFVGALLAVGVIFGDLMPVLAMLALVLQGILAFVFYRLLKAPTVAGAKIRDEIDGFRMFLMTAEKDRLEILQPPQVTPAVFEKFLPYAIALDAENAWSRKFEAEAAAAQIDPNTRAAGYTPLWYSGPSFGRLGSAGFVSALGNSVATATAAAATAPGRSSGSGGGGFSGGGGGGGGGGGW